MELNSTRSYKASARAIANDCKKENGFEETTGACLLARWSGNQPSEKKCCTSKVS